MATRAITRSRFESDGVLSFPRAVPAIQGVHLACSDRKCLMDNWVSRRTAGTVSLVVVVSGRSSSGRGVRANGTCPRHGYRVGETLVLLSRAPVLHVGAWMGVGSV